MSKIIPAINQIIKDKRKELKITQEKFAIIINKSPTTVKRYDTGDIIPENTLILICEKLNLDKFLLLEEQEKQNKLQETIFYKELINKNYVFLELENALKNANLKHNNFIEQLEFIYKSFNYTSKDFIKAEYKNDRFYIFDKTEVLDILTIEQADKFINDMQEYFEFKTERLRKEKLNK